MIIYELEDRAKYIFFIHEGETPLTKYQFWKMTDLALSRAGVHGLKFGTHSFRIGVGSMAAALGYHPDDIKCLGRWSFNTYRRYVRTLPHI